MSNRRATRRTSRHPADMESHLTDIQEDEIPTATFVEAIPYNANTSGAGRSGGVGKQRQTRYEGDGEGGDADDGVGGGEQQEVAGNGVSGANRMERSGPSFGNINYDEVDQYLESTDKKKKKKKRDSKTGSDMFKKSKSSKSVNLHSSKSASNLQRLKPWPDAFREEIVSCLTKPPNQARARAFLRKHHWPIGLHETVLKSVKKIPLRFFIVDDSGSMITNDGKRVVTQGNITKIIQCTRWSELSEALIFHAELSDALQLPTDFRLLNGADPVIVGMDGDNSNNNSNNTTTTTNDGGGRGGDSSSLDFLKEVLSESPAGPTPLCMHIEAVAEEISLLADDLRANGQKVALVICTDGESSDGNVANSMKLLLDLPVLIVIRLCTDEQQIVDYWNNIDNMLELDVDVIDDPLGDAQQVYQQNGWLTYGEPIHRVREFGASMKELDIVDESTLSSEQMRMICGYLFLGGNPRDLPHPGVDWHLFRSKVKELNDQEPKVFCTVNNKLRPWVDMARLDRIYGSQVNGTAMQAVSSACCIM